MKFSLVAIGLLLLAGVAHAKTQREIIDNAKKFTVLVTSEGLFGHGRGSGILLDSRHVLTCAHMVRDMSDEFFIYTYPLGQIVKAHVENGSAVDDMAILVLDSSVTVHVKPVFQPLTFDGDPVTVIGNTLGTMHWYVSKGVLSGSERQYLITDAAVNPGDSGGPWLNEQGEVVAISNWGIVGATNVSGGLSAKRILELFRTFDEQKKMIAMLRELLGGAPHSK